MKSKIKCKGILKSGKNKGKSCKYKAKSEGYCGKHGKRNKEVSESSKKLIYKKDMIHPGIQMISLGDIQMRSEISKIKDVLIDDLEYLKSAIRKYGENNFITKGIHFESDEPQIGKTHLILVTSWIERFYLDRRPMIVLYNRLSDKNQMLGRVKKFNEELEKIMKKLNIDEKIHEYLKLYSQPIPENPTDKVWEALLTNQRGYIPIIMGNNSQMTRLNDVLDIIKTTKETPVLIVDEIHSLITNVKKEGNNFTQKFTQLVNKVKLCGGRLIGVSATGFAAYSSSQIEEYIEIFVKVRECSFYKEKGLVYKSFKDMNVVETNWENKTMMSFEKMTNKRENNNEFNNCLIKFDQDQLSIRKMILVTFNVKNDEQEKMAEYIEKLYPDKFSIIIFNQSNKECIEEILDTEVIKNQKPIVIICRGKGTQGSTFKPGNLNQALRHDPPLLGLTHAMVCLSDEDHNEHIIQYSLRGNGWYKNDIHHPITLFINKKDHNKLRKNLKAKEDLTNQLETLSYERFYGQEPNKMREFCKMISFLDPGNRMTRPTATDLLMVHNQKYRIFGSIDIYVSYIKEHGIKPILISKRINLGKKLGEYSKFKDVQKKYQKDIGYKFGKNKEDDKIQRDLKLYFRTLMEKLIPDYNKFASLQLSYNRERIKLLEKFYPERGERYKSTYVAFGHTMKEDDELFVIKNELMVFKNDHFYVWEKTNGEICLIKYNNKDNDEFCQLKLSKS
jgi:vacuolar-type H+-ATPase subunit F/Vma7